MLDELKSCRKYTGSKSHNQDEKGISCVHVGCISAYTYIKINKDVI